jgi:ABC-type Mn2+/Zn2+ transport system permease subunit
MIAFLEFYQSQVMTGIFIGMLISALGIFVLLQRTVFFGVTLAQATHSALILSILAGFGAESATIPIALALMAPFFLIHHIGSPNADAILAGGFVFFASLSQLMTSFGGAIQSHLIAAYFGDIVTVRDDAYVDLILPISIVIIMLVILYPSLKAVIFDRDDARLIGIPSFAIEVAFFTILTVVMSLTIRLMGTFFTVAHLTIPAAFALRISRSFHAAIVLAALFSSVVTLIGFMISFYPIPFEGGTLNLPTSATIILVMSLIFIPPLFRKI